MLKSSPLESAHTKAGANFGEYNGWRLPGNYGDVEAETKALSSAMAAFDFSSFGRIKIKGSDGNELINSLLKDKAAILSTNTWIWAGIVMDNNDMQIIRVGHIKDDYIVMTMPDARSQILGRIQNIASEKRLESLTIDDITEKTAMLGVYGNGAIEAICNILPFDIEPIEHGDAVSKSFFMMKVMILGGSWLDGEGIELICPASAGPMAAGVIAKYHQKVGITPAGMDCFQIVFNQAAPAIKKYIDKNMT